jgi:hypothetical protein
VDASVVSVDAVRARRASICARCGGWIEAGAVIVQDKGPWVHRECSAFYQEQMNRGRGAESMRSYEEMVRAHGARRRRRRMSEQYVEDAVAFVEEVEKALADHGTSIENAVPRLRLAYGAVQLWLGEYDETAREVTRETADADAAIANEALAVIERGKIMTHQLHGDEPWDENRWAVDSFVEQGWRVRLLEDGVLVTTPDGIAFACIGDNDPYGEGITVGQLYAAWQTAKARRET